MSDSKLTVCHLLNSLENGGAQNLLLNLVEQTDQSIEHYVGYHTESDKSIEDKLIINGASTFKLEHSVMFDPRAITHLNAVIERRSVDLLHAHLPYQQLLARWCGQQKDVTVVGTHHNLGTTPHEAMLSLEKLSRRLEDRTVGVTESVRRAHESVLLDGHAQWDTIYNGIDIEAFNDRVTSYDTEAGEGVTYLNIGRYIPEKEQRSQIAAMETIVETSPSATLYIVGFGPLEDELRRTVRERGLGDNVEVTGYTDEPEWYYAQADVYLSSAPEEGHPITMVEAMAAGVPIVAKHFDGAGEIVVDGETGILVPIDKQEAFADAMVAMQTPSRRQEFGERAYRRALSEFDIENAAMEYQELYFEIS